MSLLKKNSLAYTILQRALFEIIQHYNDNYLLLTQNPQTLFSFFVHDIEQINSKVTVILALIAHFQTEHHYLNTSFHEFQELFGTELVLINHRNYSNRSNKFANSAEEIARDVIAFANHFRQKNKKIVLYGMCRGAAHMIVAAHMLSHQKIPFKLIVHRFSQKYINFVDFKTLSRANDFSISNGQDCSRLLPGYQYCPSLMPYLLILLFLLLFIFSKTALVITKTNIDFAKLVRMIPEEDLLILQAKGEK